MSSSQSGEASTETCGTNALRINAVISSLCPGTAGDGDRALPRDAPGENTDPSTIVAGGVLVPDVIGEAPGSELVEEKRFESEAFDRP